MYRSAHMAIIARYNFHETQPLSRSQACTALYSRLRHGTQFSLRLPPRQPQNQGNNAAVTCLNADFSQILQRQNPQLFGSSDFHNAILPINVDQIANTTSVTVTTYDLDLHTGRVGWAVELLTRRPEVTDFVLLCRRNTTQRVSRQSDLLLLLIQIYRTHTTLTPNKPL